MRKLASIQVIENLLPIDGADFIELAFIEGWQCIVKKGLHSIGDKVVFCEIDSFLPIKEQYEFLRLSSYKNSPLLGEGFKIRSMRMKKVLSQGLIIPLSDLEQTSYSGSFEVGEDVTDALEIRKWEIPESANLAGFAKGNFPYWLRKSDQERVENFKREVFEKNINSRYEITLKLDGSSTQSYFNNGILGVCSRNLELKLDQENNTFVDTAKKLGLLDALVKLNRNISVGSELMGPGIQGNREKFLEFKLFVYDIFDIDKQIYIAPKERMQVFNQLKEYGFTGDHVPIIESNVLLSDVGITDVATSKVFAKRKSINSNIAEGFVFKRMDGQFSFKSINNEYLLKFDNDETC